MPFFPPIPEKSKAVKLVAKYVGREDDSCHVPESIQNMDFFFFKGFSPWGLNGAGYFILIMAAAAAFCGLKDQFSD